MPIIVPRLTSHTVESILATSDESLLQRYRQSLNDITQLFRHAAPILKLLESPEKPLPSTISLTFHAGLVAPHGLKFAINALRDKYTMPYTTTDRNDPEADPVEHTLPGTKSLLMNALDIRVGQDQLTGHEEPVLFLGSDKEFDYSVTLPAHMGNVVWSIAIDPACTPIRTPATA